MPWNLPTLKTVRQNARAYIMGSLKGSNALIPNSVLRVLADVNAGLAHLVLQFIAWLANQILPTDAVDEWLDRWATMYLVNADGSKGRKQATFAVGTFNATVVSQTGATIFAGTLLGGANGVTYQITAQGSATAPGTVTVPIIALTAGAIGNLDTGTPLSFQVPPTGVLIGGQVGVLTGGADTETNDQLRYRLLLRLANPPMGGDTNDYVQWTLAVPGVTRAWAAQDMGVGTMTVRFMCDVLRAAQGGFPTQTDIDAVTAYLNTVRPVTVKDLFVVAPVPFPINFTISNLTPDDATTWTDIIASVNAMLFTKAAPAFTLNGVLQPAQTIFAVWVNDAIYNAPGVESFDFVASDFVPPNNGSLAVLGNVIHG
jgi:uncharacterized phage protein gp47/JayE